MHAALTGIVRHLLTAVGGGLLANGFVTATEIELLAGAVVTIGGVVWSVLAKRKSA